MSFGYSSNETEDNSVATKVDEVKDINGDKNLISPDESSDLNDINKNNIVEDKKDNNDDEISFSHNLEKGSSIEIEDKTYTVDEQGNVIDSEGNIFKHENEVSDWLKEYETENENNNEEINIDNIKKIFDTEFTDDEGNEIEFENNVQGIKSYVDSIIESSLEEAQETAINTLYEKIPILKDLIPYYIANGNSLDGFNETMRDYSSIEIDDDNEAQQIEIIRTAWSEQGRKGDFNKYINFLKADGTLAEVANEELSALKEAYEEYRQTIAKEAEEKEQEEINRQTAYWNGVKEVIDNRNIAGYKIPETIIVNKNGQKISYTPNDFFNYIFQVDDKGHSRYEYDIAKQTPQERRDDEILRAYLRFTGGSYSNLIDIAINNEQVKKLKLTSKTRKQAVTVKINKPESNKNNTNFGYN